MTVLRIVLVGLILCLVFWGGVFAGAGLVIEKECTSLRKKCYELDVQADKDEHNER